ncbi:MAG: ParB/RepB/Spo0J family partition protein [Bacteroidales bacterium]|nr:ParB/RepB/Spo0J family partition protein [Bacteroidales bacterium]
MTKKKAALGRGLGALIESSDYDNRRDVTAAKGSDKFEEVAIGDIEANPFQPRTEFDEVAIEELSLSIKELGIIQPITVRRLESGKFQLISGERRFKASKLAGLKKVPAFVREVEDNQMLEMALVENIQREDLNSIEIAISYQRLIEECSLTQESMSERVGKKRTTVTNYLRLLKLPAEIQIGVRDRLIGMGHAKAILAYGDEKAMKKLFFRTVEEGLSVRKVEEIVRLAQNPEEKSESKKEDEQPEIVQNYTQLLTQKFEAKVEIKRSSKGSGKLIIPFVSDNDLERIMEMLAQKKK